MSQCALYFFNKATHTETERDTPVATIEDVPVFVSSLLNQYESKSKLTWHNGQVPSDEIWLKIGGDHGGDSFKVVCKLQTWRVQIHGKTRS